MMIGQLSWEKIHPIGLLNIWQLCILVFTCNALFIAESLENRVAVALDVTSR